MFNIFDKMLKKYWTLLANVYGHVHDNDKDSFLAKLSSYCFKAKHPLLIGGDFNILRFSSDKNKNYVDNNFSNAFNLIINIYELRELPLIGGKFTQSNNRKEPTLERLDRVLMDEAWGKEFPLCILKKIPRYILDHNPLILNTEMTQKTDSKPFCFGNSWLKHP